MEYGTKSRKQRGSAKRERNKRNKYLSAMDTKALTNANIECRITSCDNVAEHEFTKEYGATFHSCHRFIQRVFGYDGESSREDLQKAAILIWKNIPEARLVGEGKFPLMDDWVAVIHNGVCVTILDKRG